MWEYRHESVVRSANEYVNRRIPTNGIASFWALLKRGYPGSCHQMSVKHLLRFVDEFRYRWNNRDQHTLEFIAAMMGRGLTHHQLMDGDAS